MTALRANLRALLEAIGESDTLIGGSLETILRTPLAWNGATIEVVTTESFPSPTVLALDGEAITVTVLDSDTFTVVSRPLAHPATPIVAPGSRVYDIGRVYSELDIARLQLLVNYATGDYLSHIGENYGVGRPGFRGSPLFLTDDLYREYVKIISFLQAGPRYGIMRVLYAMFPPTILTGTVHATNEVRVTFAGPLLPKHLKRGLIRVGDDYHRIVSIDPGRTWIDLSNRAGPTWSRAQFTLGTPIVVELIPWDIWEEPDEPGRFYIELYQTGIVGLPYGSTYIQGGEAQTSSNNVTVTINDTPTQVLGVWLSTDIERSGTNYYSLGSSFLGPVLTLATPLPGALTAVLVDYGAVAPGTAQVLEDVTDIAGNDIENSPVGTYWPAYLSNYSAYLTESGVLELIRAFGALPVVSDGATWVFGP